MDGRAFWAGVFGNPKPVEIEIGSGTGTFLLQASLDHPERNYFGIEHSRSRAAMVHIQIAMEQRSNARIIGADAACVVRHVIPNGSVHAFHIYFPDPWWKRRHHRRRLFTPQFARDLTRALVPGGFVFTATDVPDVFDLIRASMAMTQSFTEAPELRSPRRHPTVFERKGTLAGSQISEMCFRNATHSTRGAAPR